MMRHLHLIRHASTQPTPDLPPPEWPLTAEGLQQARALAEGLAHLSVRRVVTSTEPKAVQTGGVIADRLGVPLEQRAGLQEHGRLQSQHAPTREAFEARMHEFFARPTERVFGTESADEARFRFAQAVHEVMRDEEGDGLIVSHGTVISLLVAHANGLDARSFWSTLRMPDHLVVDWPSLRQTTDLNAHHLM